MDCGRRFPHRRCRSKYWSEHTKGRLEQKLPPPFGAYFNP
ncbi:hypothetical protein CLOSTMETH_01251 [[Clostridium] methylpentosum DSM 5476]|uniref:Uncharacterized protein n=1 Tax=[Clostridium] methylpentosum DSM 5476 TaxID=537013 RepID=C0EBN3_9FIRM|nr:hypothetical protein CLOSTMETH_01251 [[Clostridium] methylpentosum DSM 5476]